MEITISSFDHPSVLRATAQLLEQLAAQDTRSAFLQSVGSAQPSSAVRAEPVMACNPVQSEPCGLPSGDQISEVATESVAPVAEPVATAPARKRGRPAKTEVVAIPTEPASPEPVNEAPALVTGDVISVDDVRTALQRYTEKHGMPKAIAKLSGYGAARVSEISEDKRAQFVAECNE